MKFDLNKDKRIRKALDINQELFQGLLVAFLVLLLMEQLWARSVTRFLNMNILLFIVIVSGALAVLTQKEKKKREDVNKKKWLIISAVSGLLGGIIIWYQLNQFAYGALISVIGALLIFLLSWLVVDEDASTIGKNAKKRIKN